MVIDPDNDLLIFKSRRERNAGGKRGGVRSAWSTHKVDFSSAKRELERIDRPIAEGIGSIVRSAESRGRKKRVENVAESEAAPSILAENEREMEEMDEKVKDMLDAMKTINERQRALSEKES
jgi:hypothetical protein